MPVNCFYRDVLECLGPELCPPWNCYGDDQEIYLPGNQPGKEWPWHGLDLNQYRDIWHSHCEVTSSRDMTHGQLAPQGKFWSYNITGSKYRKAVDVELSNVFYHEQPGHYDSLDDPRLWTVVEHRVQEKCSTGGKYYSLVHYGTLQPSRFDTSQAPCEHIRELHQTLWLPEGFWRWLRQDGFDGWIWRGFTHGPCDTGLCGHGVLSTPMIMPWEQCTYVPCPNQCVDVMNEEGQTECPSRPQSWLVSFISNLITNVLLPYLVLAILVRCDPSK